LDYCCFSPNEVHYDGQYTKDQEKFYEFLDKHHETNYGKNGKRQQNESLRPNVQALEKAYSLVDERLDVAVDCVDNRHSVNIHLFPPLLWINLLYYVV